MGIHKTGYRCIIMYHHHHLKKIQILQFDYKVPFHLKRIIYICIYHHELKTFITRQRFIMFGDHLAICLYLIIKIVNVGKAKYNLCYNLWPEPFTIRLRVAIFVLELTCVYYAIHMIKLRTYMFKRFIHHFHFVSEASVTSPTIGQHAHVTDDTTSGHASDHCFAKYDSYRGKTR